LDTPIERERNVSLDVLTVARELLHDPSDPVSERRESPCRALVAEDDEEMRALVVLALRDEHFEVDEVGDGRLMWVRTIHSRRYDLVVSDLRLPMVDGLTVLEDLRERVPSTGLILMTAFADDSVRVRARELGVVLLDKPFQMGELRAAARHLRDAATGKTEGGIASVSDVESRDPGGPPPLESRPGRPRG
jgi:two-component system cell cycle response regulator CpdR